MKTPSILAALTVLGLGALQGTAHAAQSKELVNQKQGVLLITNDALKEAWQPFADWKTQTGKPTKIVTVAQIDKAYKGKDIQEKIKNCVLDHANKRGTSWVILGGDSGPDGGIVPDRNSKHTVYGRMKYSDIPSDSYYISEKSWDANGDGIYGDWANDKGELSWTNDKVVIGRIPMRSEKDVANYTSKIIAYETKFPEADKYAEKMVYTCTVKSACPKLKTSWKDVSSVWPGDGKYFFTHETPWDKNRKGDHDLSPQNWVSMINNKTASKLHMHGHGHLPVWVLEHHKNVSAKTVAQLKNKNAYLCMTTVSCFTGQFDAVKDPCITESILRQPEGGAVMIIAPAREGVPIFHNPNQDFKLMVSEGKMDGTTQLLTSFWQHGLQKNLTAGEAFRAAKQDMVADAQKTSGYHWCLAEINFLGDPTLDLRAKSPTTPALDVKKNGQTISVKTNAPTGAVVCAWLKGKYYQRALVKDGGVVTLKVPAGVKGKAHVTVSGASLNTVTKALEL